MQSKLSHWSVRNASRIGHGEETLLPFVETGKDAIRRIDGCTLTKLIDGCFKDRIDEFHIVDCRFPYEYKGGHVLGAVNVTSTAQIEELYLKSPRIGKKLVIVFHCEFSSHRAPKMALHLRNQDRNANMERYPDLYYPEIYILKGGYRNFYQEFKDYCDPQSYVEMNDDCYKEELRKAMAGYKRVFQKSKSCQDVMFGRR